MEIRTHFHHKASAMKKFIDALEVLTVALIAFGSLLWWIGLPIGSALEHSKLAPEINSIIFCGMLLLIVIWCSGCAAVGFMAQRQGRDRSGTIWFVIALVTSPFLALIILRMARDHDEKRLIV